MSIRKKLFSFIIFILALFIYLSPLYSQSTSDGQNNGGGSPYSPTDGDPNAGGGGNDGGGTSSSDSSKSSSSKSSSSKSSSSSSDSSSSDSSSSKSSSSSSSSSGSSTSEDENKELLRQVNQALESLTASLTDYQINFAAVQNLTKAPALAAQTASTNQTTMNVQSPVYGDPVRLTSGEYITNVTDLNFNYFGLTIDSSRYYQSGYKGSHSLGEGWAYTYDTRIIRGISHTDDVILALEEIKGQLLSSLSDARKVKNKVDQVVDYVSSNYSSIIGADDAANRVNQIISELSEMLDNVNSDLEQAKNDQQMAKEQESLNCYTYNESDPDYYTDIGNNTLTYVDERGTAYLFMIDETADYDTALLLPDGTKNYYPGGAEAKSTASRNSLTIRSDGGFILNTPEGIRKFFNFYGLIEKIEDLNHNQIIFNYDDLYQLVQITDGADRAIILTRDSNGRIVKAQGPEGSYIYRYSNNMLASVIDPMGYETTYCYQSGVITEVIHPDGSSRKFLYFDLPESFKVSTVTDEEGFSEHFIYNELEKYTIYRNDEGLDEIHYYDDFYRETSIEYADGSKVFFTYNDNHLLTQKIDEAGHITKYSYDANQHLTSVDYPDETRENWIYGAYDRVLSHTDRGGYETQYNYDSTGNLLKVVYPDHTENIYQYDSRGSLITSRERTGEIKKYSYDQYGYLAEVTGFDGSITRLENSLTGDLLAVILPDGGETHYQYNLNNLPVRVVDSLGYGESFSYDCRGNLTEHTDKRGNKTLYEYNSRRDLVKVVYANGDNIELTYRMDGKILTKSLNQWSTTQNSYNSRGRLTATLQVETDIETLFSYDSTGNLITRIDGEGNRVNYQYGKNGKIKSIHRDGNIKTFSYNKKGYVTSVTDELGGVTCYDYNSMGELTRTVDPAGGEKSYHYEAGRLLSSTDELGAITSYSYEIGRLKSVINSKGHETVKTYNNQGLIASIRDERGALWQYHYNRRGELIKTTDPAGYEEVFNYDGSGNMILKKDHRGYETGYSYDSLNRLISMTNPAGGETFYQYNCLDQKISVISPDGGQALSQYDPAGRLVTVTNPGGGETHYHYDRCSRPVKITDPAGRVKSYTYDYRGLLTGEINGAGESISYIYDPVGNRTAFTDGRGYTYQYIYNLKKQLIEELNPAGESQTFRYDRAGRMTGKKDFKGVETFFVYDSLGQLIEEQVDNKTMKRFSYDKTGHLTEAWSPDAHYRYDYDLCGRQTASSDLITGSQVISIYDPAGNRTARKVNETGQTSYYQYNGLNQPVKITGPDGKATTIKYDQAGRETEIIYPDRTVTEKLYHLSGKVMMEKTTAGREILKGAAYLYNQSGEKTLEIDERGRIKKFEYDRAGRLKQGGYYFDDDKKAVDHKERLSLGLYQMGPCQPEKLSIQDNQAKELLSLYGKIRKYDNPVNLHQYQWVEKFTYDQAGNILQKNNGWGKINYQYDKLNRLIKAGNRQYSYDKNGNLMTESIEGKKVDYLYSYDNRLIESYTDHPQVISTMKASHVKGVSYQYDALGRRISRLYFYRNSGSTENRWEAESHRRFIYDGRSYQTLADMRDMNINYQGPCQSTAYRTLNHYLYNGSRLISRTDYAGYYSGQYGPGYTTYFHSDSQNSITLATTGGGAVKEWYQYDAFGKIYDRKVYDQNEFGYNGKRFDSARQLYDYGFRDYKPALMRWTTVDPIREGVNWYLYCLNDPVNYIDPLGLCKKKNNYDNLLNCGTPEQQAEYKVNLESWKVRQEKRNLLFRALSDFYDPAPKLPNLVYGVFPDISKTGGVKEFLKWLNKGPKNVTIYKGIKKGKDVYVGITSNINRRAAQHSSRFSRLQKVTNKAFTRNEARAIEQILIEANPNYINKINSISNKHRFYKQAIKWAKSLFD